MMSFLDESELAGLGLKAFGANVQISRKASIHGAQRISIGSNVRIDDFCVISAGEGGIEIGNHVHIAVFVSVIGSARIVVGDFAGLSGRSAIYSSSDDFSGNVLTGPTVPDQFKNVDSRPVTIGRHVVVGAGCVVLPGVTIGDGAAVGALSVVNRDCDAFKIYVGSPARAIKDRGRKLLELEEQMRDAPRSN